MEQKWGKTLFCSDQLFSATNTLIQLCSNLSNTFSSIKYFFRRICNAINTIILRYFAIMKHRNSRWDIVFLQISAQVLENTCYRLRTAFCRRPLRHVYIVVAQYLQVKILDKTCETVQFLQISGLHFHDYFGKLFDTKWEITTVRLSWAAMEVS